MSTVTTKFLVAGPQECGVGSANEVAADGCICGCGACATVTDPANSRNDVATASFTDCALATNPEYNERQMYGSGAVTLERGVCEVSCDWTAG